MGHPNGAWRCQYGTWHDLYEECTCSPATVLAAALPDHDRVDEAVGAELDADVLQGRQFRLALEAFDLDVQRVMWEQNVGRRTAVHVVEASRRLDARKAEIRAARAAA